jgi:hypothetical protein
LSYFGWDSGGVSELITALLGAALILTAVALVFGQ